MAKNKRLNDRQCFELHTLLVSKLSDTIKCTFEYAATHDYDPRETTKFIYSFLQVTGREEIINKLLEMCLTDILSNDTNIKNIDFPNSGKNSENKSSDTKNTER